jgi:hypothetical protein
MLPGVLPKVLSSAVLSSTGHRWTCATGFAADGSVPGQWGLGTNRKAHEATRVRRTLPPPNKIIAEGTDWRFFNELKHELKA